MKHPRSKEIESSLRGEWFYLRRKPILDIDLGPVINGCLYTYDGRFMGDFSRWSYVDGKGYRHCLSATVQLLRMSERGAKFRDQEGHTEWITFESLATDYAAVRLLDILESPSGRCLLHDDCRRVPALGDACRKKRLEEATRLARERRRAEFAKIQAKWHLWRTV